MRSGIIAQCAFCVTRGNVAQASFRFLAQNFGRKICPLAWAHSSDRCRSCFWRGRIPDIPERDYLRVWAQEDLNVIVIVMATLGKFALTVTFAVCYLYSGEIYPTAIRNVGLGSNSACARVGAMVAPYITLLAKDVAWLPMVLFGALAVVAALLAAMLPETRNCHLPETIEDGENFN
ncbi:PREDICTED: organic cation transporter protein-like, partial [Priapulus caudatus]|uniref:Organic cation transporter protein-like n=1 Tax=Priapulus caudatus TaxID=37621 RepID=A0ABM1F2C2_PRICU